MARDARNSDLIPKRTLQSVSIKDFIDDWIYRIDLDADYQREKIWSRENRLLLLDSVITNIDIPKLYLARTDGEGFDFECIDGKQRMTTLLDFFKPEPDERPLTVHIAGEDYTYKRLKNELPSLAKKVEDFELTFVIYQDHQNELFLHDIFRRLQLGVRLNAGELLKTYTGTIRDFVYKENGRNAPFLRNTKLSERRFSRQFALSQICINSFSRSDSGEFVRARYDDLGDFFKSYATIDENDHNLVRIRSVLELMDCHFGEAATHISSRAVAVSAYLFSESLYLEKKQALISECASFVAALLDEIRSDLRLLSKYENPKNTFVLENFQKYVSQASVEHYAIKRRHEFLHRAFKHFRSPKTKGEIIHSA